MNGYEKMPGQERSAENLAAAQNIIDAKSVNEHTAEAAGNAEEVIKTLNEMWSERGFSPEQCVFALALVTINYRETVPEKFGGKAMFDRVAASAREYYDANK